MIKQIKALASMLMMKSAIAIQAPSLPDLPDTFSVMLEVNIINKGYSFTMEESYDYGKNVMSFMSTSPTLHKLTVDYYNDDEQVSIHFDPRDPAVSFRHGGNNGVTRNCTLKAISRKTVDGHVKNTADMLRFGKDYNQTYIGVSSIRGIDCDHWSTHIAHPMGPNSTTAYDLHWYFAVEGWADSGEFRVPVRANIEGNTTMDGVTHNFNHNYEYINFHTKPAAWLHPQIKESRYKTWLEGCDFSHYCAAHPLNDDACTLNLVAGGEGNQDGDDGDKPSSITFSGILIGAAAGILFSSIIYVFCIGPLLKAQKSTMTMSSDDDRGIEAAPFNRT